MTLTSLVVTNRW